MGAPDQPALREQVDADPAVARIIDFARHLGVARNASTHAAGVVISREPLTGSCRCEGDQLWTR